jgi:hypothetical protein
MLLAFFHAAFATRWIVYGTRDKTIIANMKIGKRELFSSAVFPILIFLDQSKHPQQVESNQRTDLLPALSR